MDNVVFEDPSKPRPRPKRPPPVEQTPESLARASHDSGGPPGSIISLKQAGDNLLYSGSATSLDKPKSCAVSPANLHALAISTSSKMISVDETTLPTLEPVTIPESETDLDNPGRPDSLFSTPEPEGWFTDHEEDKVRCTASYDPGAYQDSADQTNRTDHNGRPDTSTTMARQDDLLNTDTMVSIDNPLVPSLNRGTDCAWLHAASQDSGNPENYNSQISPAARNSRLRQDYIHHMSMGGESLNAVESLPPSLCKKPASKAESRTTPVALAGPTCDGDDDTVWQYGRLLDYKVVEGRSLVMVPWMPTWEPSDEFPEDEVEQVRRRYHVRLQGRLQGRGRGRPRGKRDVRRRRPVRS